MLLNIILCMKEKDIKRGRLDSAIDLFMELLPGMMEEHEGEWLVIREGNKEPLGGYWNSPEDALVAAAKEYGIADFLVRQVSQEYVEHGRLGKPINIGMPWNFRDPILFESKETG